MEKKEIGCIIKRAIEMQKWISFNKKLNENTYKRIVVSIEKCKNTVESSNFSTYIIQTERGKAKLVINKATNVPIVGSIIEFKINAIKGSYNQFYISSIINEEKRAGEHYLFELWEQEKFEKIYKYGSFEL
jgi:hypothetical protein